MPSANSVAAYEPEENQSSTAVGDISRKSDECHLEYPHNKAFAALFHASVLKEHVEEDGPICLVARTPEPQHRSWRFSGQSCATQDLRISRPCGRFPRQQFTPPLGALRVP